MESTNHKESVYSDAYGSTLRSGHIGTFENPYTTIADQRLHIIFA